MLIIIENNIKVMYFQFQQLIIFIYYLVDWFYIIFIIIIGYKCNTKRNSKENNFSFKHNV